MLHEWYVTERCRKFIQMSYKFDGSGRASRQPQFIVHQCVHMIYAFRCIYIIHCLLSLKDWQVSQPAQLSEAYFNSTVPSAFTAIQNIKRPAKECIDDNHRQNVTWTNESFTALDVHTGPQGLGRTPVTHLLLRQIFRGMVSDIKALLVTLGNYIYIYIIPYQQTAFIMCGMSHPLIRCANDESFRLQGLERHLNKHFQRRGTVHLQQELGS